MTFHHPLLEDHYTICSNVYGHSLNVPPDAHQDDDFLKAVQAGYDNATLHDCGHLVVDKSTNSLAFLVTVRLEDDTKLPTRALVKLSMSYGCPVRLMAVPDGGPGYPAYQLVTAQLDSTDKFCDAHNLVVAIYGAEQAARRAATPPVVAVSTEQSLLAMLAAQANSDDGAALRLANLLHLNIQHEGPLNSQGCDRVFVTPKGYGHLNQEAVYADFDSVDVAVRRAISRAAQALLRERN